MAARRAIRAGGISGSILAYILAVPALAQPDPVTETADDDDRNPDIIVTATRRAQRLQDVPVSVTALDQEELTRRNATRVRDLEFSIPNFVIVGAAENQGIDITLRGIRASAFNAGFESSLSMYIDGVVLGRPFGFNQDLADLERIEVLRGPQGTLFGRNTLSGAINIITRKPSNETQVAGTLNVGNYNLFQGYASLNVPLSETVFFRGTMFGSHRNGYYENQNGPDLDDEAAIGGRLQFRFVPSDRLTIDLSADALDEERNILFGEAADTSVGSVPGPFTVAPNFQPREDRRLRGLNLTANYDFGDGYTLTSITGWRDARSSTTSDSDASSVDFANSLQAYEQDQFSQEVRLTSPAADRFNFILGLYYFQQDLDQNWVDNLRPGFPAFPQINPKSRSMNASIETQNYAAFAHANFRITDQLEVFGGIRFDHERKDAVFQQTGIVAFGTPNIPLTRDRQSEDNFVPLVGVNFRPNDDILLYAKFSNSFKSGGWNAEFLARINDWEFASEHVDAYEVGIKTEWFNDLLRVNAALFRLDYQDLQVATFNPVTLGIDIQNAASARSQGLELEVSASPMRWLRLQANYGYTDAEYLDFQVNAATNLRGTRLPAAPTHTFSASFDISAPINSDLNFAARGEYTWRSKAIFAPSNVTDPFFRATEQSSTALLNARIGIEAEDGRWSAFLWAKNLTDQLYLTTLRRNAFGVNQATFGPPRTYGVQLNFRF